MRPVPLARTIAPAGALLVLLAGCGSGGGTAPTISDLSISPTQLTVGQLATLTGELMVVDPDGDESEIDVAVKLPSGQSQSLAPTMLQGASTDAPEPIEFVLALTPPAAGSYDVTVHCTDAAGNESNGLSTTFTAK